MSRCFDCCWVLDKQTSSIQSVSGQPGQTSFQLLLCVLHGDISVPLRLKVLNYTFWKWNLNNLTVIQNWFFFVYIKCCNITSSSSSSSTRSACVSSADCSISLLWYKQVILEVTSKRNCELFFLKANSYTVSWRTSECKLIGLETSVDENKII